MFLLLELEYSDVICATEESTVANAFACVYIYMCESLLRKIQVSEDVASKAKGWKEGKSWKHDQAPYAKEIIP
jgi:hypothetical protein